MSPRRPDSESRDRNRSPDPAEPFVADDGLGDPAIEWQDVYDYLAELRGMAQGLLALEFSTATLQPTGLVVTALRRQKRIDQDWQDVSWRDRSHFLSAMYVAMRRALIDHGRKRRGQRVIPTVPLRAQDLEIEDLRTAHQHPEQIEALVQALDGLADQDAQLVEIVEHRYFSGYTISQIARIMEVSERTVDRLWRRARTLIHDRVMNLLNRDDGVSA